MAAKYSSISSKVQSDALGRRLAPRTMSLATAFIRSTSAPGGSRGCRALLEQVAEHGEDLRGRDDLLHREVHVRVPHAGVLFPQVLVLVGHLHVGEVAAQRQQP